MKSKAPLALMEQLVMILVFALTAALCLQVFVFSDSLSASGADRDRAMMAVQNAAETLKNGRGDMDALTDLLGGERHEDSWRMGLNNEWQPTDLKSASFILHAAPKADDLPLLGSALVQAALADGKTLFEVTVSWQEAPYGETN